MQRYFYSDPIAVFLQRDEASILGLLASRNSFSLDVTQRDAWVRQIAILKDSLRSVSGRAVDSGVGVDSRTDWASGQVYFEYSIPRLGRRADVVVLLGSVVFVIEFKVGESGYPAAAVDQVWDYALDLKNFHESSHSCVICPVLVATEAAYRVPEIRQSGHTDRVLEPILCHGDSLAAALTLVSGTIEDLAVDPQAWEAGRYSPSPTIIEAATALYNGHSVEEISRSDSGAVNLTQTSECVEQIIGWARDNQRKAICFVTGVPGAGKTLVGLNVATKQTNADDGLHSVFLSGNGPLVAVLREALARNTVALALERGQKKRKGDATSEVKMFIQNVHHFRDECLVDAQRPPIEHVTIFDEAQRAWNLEQTAAFMSRKKGQPGFSQSEPEFLISCLDRHPDWAVVVCLVGGGQEINTGEAGIAEWIDSVLRSFPQWQLFISSRLVEREYAAGQAVDKAREHGNCTLEKSLHLAVSMRSFRAENVSQFVKHLLDLEVEQARLAYQSLAARYPLVMTRDLSTAKRWLREKARGSERFGIVVSSQAQRLKPQAIDVRTPVDPIHWFLGPKSDVRSSFYLEDVATEFQVQGLELDWACVTWDADFRRTDAGWGHFSFVGDRWNRINKLTRQEYLKNAYRVLLTRARQGMVIVVPQGADEDPTRSRPFYDRTYEYLRELGIAEV